MSGLSIYQPSPIRRVRATKAEVEARREALSRDRRRATADDGPPSLLSGDCSRCRREDGGRIYQSPDRSRFDAPIRRASLCWLADATRWMRKPDTFGGIEEALDDCARYYRKALWRDAGAYAEIWLEKDALAGVIYPITDTYDVPLMVARGYASLSFLHSAAEAISERGVPVYIYHLGDFDPVASMPARRSRRRCASLRRTPKYISSGLPSRPSKLTYGICRHGRQSRPIAAQKALAPSASSWTLSRLITSVQSAGGDRATFAARAVQDPEGRRGKRAAGHQGFRERPKRAATPMTHKNEPRLFRGAAVRTIYSKGKQQMCRRQSKAICLCQHTTATPRTSTPMCGRIGNRRRTLAPSLTPATAEP